MAPFDASVSWRHQIAFIVNRVDQGSGITVDWSLWAFIDRLPGSATLAEKFDTDTSPSRRCAT